MPQSAALRNGPRWRLDALGPGLLAASCLYLALPYLILFCGWLRWWLALPAVALVAVGCSQIVGRANRLFAAPGLAPQAPTFGWAQLLLLGVVALLLSGLSGMGGYGVQEGDYLKHNAVLKSLIEQPWPVMLTTDVGRFPLVYYTAWYLPAALLGKVAGWTAANHFLFAWGTVGLVLSMLWFCLLARRLNWLAIAVFVAFSGLDVVGAAFLKLLAFDWAAFDWSHLDWGSLKWWDWEIRWWAGPCTWSYSSHLAQLFWVPQQALGGWIVTGMIVHLFWRGDDAARRPMFFVTALSALWSPFVTLGLAPLLAADFLFDGRRFAKRVRAWLTVPNLCGAGLLGLTGLYYLARTRPIPFTDDPVSRFRFFSTPEWSGLAFLWRVLLFFLLEVGLLALLAWVVRPPATRRCRGLLALGLVFLLLLPLFRYGRNNDLAMRASMPCLMVLALFLAKALLDQTANRTRRLILAGALAVAATNPVAEVYRHLCEIRRRGPVVMVPDPASIETLWDQSIAIRRRNERREPNSGSDFFFRQYVGSEDSLFFRYLARSPAPVEGSAP